MSAQVSPQIRHSRPLNYVEPGAERGEVILVGGTGGADDTCSAGSGELDRQGSDRSGRSVDQHGLPASDAEQVQDPLGRRARHGQRDRVLPVEAGGLGDYGGGQRVLGV